MKKSKIKPIEYLRDLESVLEIVKKLDNIDFETIDVNQLLKITKNQTKKIKNKYKDLDTKK